MKIKLKSTILLILTSIVLNAQQYGYTWLHPKQQANPIFGIAFQDGNTGWAVGSKGLVMKTSDNGENWEVIRGSEVGREDFYDLLILPNGNILTTGSAGKVMKSTDGGQSWFFPTQPGNDILRDILLRLDGVVSACGSNGSVIISTDNGETWTSKGANNGVLFTHHFWRNANECMAVTSTGLYRTTDQGENWDLVLTKLFGFNEVFMLNDTVAYILGFNETYQSTDGGGTWAPVPLSTDAYQFRTLIIENSHWLRVSFGEGGEIFETLNGGLSWDQYQPVQGIKGYSCITRNSTGRVFFGSSIGDIFYSDDLSHTVTNSTTNYSSCGSGHAPTIAYIGDGKIFAVLDGEAYSPSGCEKVFLRSGNDGEDWDTINGDFLFWGAYSLAFHDSLTGFIGSLQTFGSSGIYRTIDGGFTWEMASVPVNGSVVQFALPDENMFYAALNSHQFHTGSLLFSSDGGQVWTELGNGLPTGNFECLGVVFPYPETGYTFGTVDSGPVLYKTTDSGNSWQLLPANNLPKTYSLVWINDTVGLASNAQSTGDKGIYKTFDGGINWTKIMDSRIPKLIIRDDKTIAAIPFYESFFYESRDMGASWDSIYTFVSSTGFENESIRPKSILGYGSSWLIGNSGNKIIRADDISYDLTLMLEGPFEGAQMTTDLNASGFLPLLQPFNVEPWNYGGTEIVDSIPGDNIVDWVLLEFRDAPNAASAASGTMVSRQAAFLLNNGDVVGLDGNSVSGLLQSVTTLIVNHLFIVIHHRNHLSIMSADPLTKTLGIYKYDFSASANAAYSNSSNGQVQIAPNVWGLYGGDGNGDGVINIFDKEVTWGTDAGASGYKQSDYNLDGEVDNSDKNDIWVKNPGTGTQVPD